MRDNYYTLPNGDKVKDGDKLVLKKVESEMFQETEYLVRYEYDEWRIKYQGNFPSEYSLSTYEDELKLKL